MNKVKLEPDINQISVSTNFTSGVKLDEMPQLDEAEDKDPLSCTSNIVISEFVSCSTIKLENILVENDCQNEFSEFDKPRSHIISHLSENAEPRETPDFKDELFYSDCGIQEQTFPVGSFGVSDIHDSSRPIGSVNSRSCGVSAVAGIVDGSTYGQQNQETFFEATGEGYDSSDQLVILDATSSNSFNTVMDTGDIILRCDHCQKQFRDLNRLRSHIIVHLSEGSATGAEDKPFTCEFRNKSFSRSDDRLQHIRTHTGEKSFKCDFCDKSFTRASSLTAHVRTHTGEKVFTCDYCDRKFAHAGLRDRHIRIHTGEKPFKCDFCDKRFAQTGARNAHIRTHTGEKLLTCDYCDRKFAHASHRDTHIRTHTGEKPFTCDFCDKTFAQISARNAHVRTHTGEKLLSCDHCDRKFASAGFLDRHIRTHTGEKPFTCDFCDKRFAQTSSRNAHLRTHTGKNLFACDYCDRKFANVGPRDTHMRIHTGETPYSCDVCDKTFKQASNRNKHMKTHTRKKPLLVTSVTH